MKSGRRVRGAVEVPVLLCYKHCYWNTGTHCKNKEHLLLWAVGCGLLLLGCSVNARR